MPTAARTATARRQGPWGEVGEEPLGHGVEQCVLVADAAVEGERRHAQPGGHGAHADGVEPLLAEDGEGRVDDVLGGQLQRGRPVADRGGHGARVAHPITV